MGGTNAADNVRSASCRALTLTALTVHCIGGLITCQRTTHGGMITQRTIAHVLRQNVSRCIRSRTPTSDGVQALMSCAQTARRRAQSVPDNIVHSFCHEHKLPHAHHLPAACVVQLVLCTTASFCRRVRRKDNSDSRDCQQLPKRRHSAM